MRECPHPAPHHACARGGVCPLRIWPYTPRAGCLVHMSRGRLTPWSVYSQLSTTHPQWKTIEKSKKNQNNRKTTSKLNILTHSKKIKIKITATPQDIKKKSQKLKMGGREENKGERKINLAGREIGKEERRKEEKRQMEEEREEIENDFRVRLKRDFSLLIK